MKKTASQIAHDILEKVAAPRWKREMAPGGAMSGASPALLEDIKDMGVDLMDPLDRGKYRASTDSFLAQETLKNPMLKPHLNPAYVEQAKKLHHPSYRRALSDNIFHLGEDGFATYELGAPSRGRYSPWSKYVNQEKDILKRLQAVLRRAV